MVRPPELERGRELLARLGEIVSQGGAEEGSGIYSITTVMARLEEPAD